MYSVANAALNRVHRIEHCGSSLLVIRYMSYIPGNLNGLNDLMVNQILDIGIIFRERFQSFLRSLKTGI